MSYNFLSWIGYTHAIFWNYQWAKTKMKVGLFEIWSSFLEQFISKIPRILLPRFMRILCNVQFHRKRNSQAGWIMMHDGKEGFGILRNFYQSNEANLHKQIMICWNGGSFHKMLGFSA